MKYILVLIAVLASAVYAFNPNDMADAEVMAITPCQDSVCVLLKKDGKEYVAVGFFGQDGTYYPQAIFVVEGKKLRQLWSAKWKET